MTLLTPKQVADKLKVGKSKVYQLAKEGRLACFKIGGSVRFSEEDIDEYLNKHRMKAIKYL
ncbi:MAG: helix-turn-helix domain-containing protein [Candidatus Saccharimonadales bacterium]